MKTILYAFTIGLGLTACGGNDSDSQAKEANEKRIEQQATGISDDAKKEARKTSDYFVEMASMSLTAYELSQLAAKQATNPEVKGFAQQAVNAYVQQEKDLRTISKDLKLVIPKELSKEGRDRLDNVKDEKPGTAFDLEYLKEMEKVHDKAADVADDLADDAPNDEVREYATRSRKDNTERRERAKSIRNVLN